MKTFWLIASAAVGFFWGTLVGLITQSWLAFTALFIVGFFVNMMVGGMLIARVKVTALWNTM